MIPEGYHIEQQLGRNRARALSRATPTAGGASVLLKTSPADRPGSLENAALLREHSLLASLHGSGLPRVLAADTTGDRVTLVFEDPGGELLERHLADGPLDLALALRSAVQLVDALAQLHRAGIIHKDVTPASILLDTSGGRATLIDHAIAVRVSSEHPPARHPSVLEGTLAYISPEQTGRMNREVDYRSDFYSLGVTLYQMLSGHLPFESNDPLALVHAHIARTPPPLWQRNPGIPRPVSAIVMKLLAKTPEERYQSAAGLRGDLQRSLDEWLATGTVVHVVAGANDVSDRFVLPQRLYGREDDITLLTASFDRARQGAVEMLMVSGYAGIGKTTLIRELYKPLVAGEGYFVSGKFDQIVRVPYGALIQALSALIHHLLTAGEAELDAWRERLRTVLGAGAGVLATVIPEVELILGPQPTPPTMGPEETQNRFRLVLQNFVRAFARPERPLVIFLDDLQWADPATLNLLEPLLSSPDIRALLVIGAYRDNEVGEDHPLTGVVRSLDHAEVSVHRIALGALTLPQLSALIGDALHTDAAAAEPLAALVLRQTGGNPFFVTQFLRALFDGGLLHFAYASGTWSYELDAIAAAGITDNVIDLMTAKLQRVSPGTRRTLTLGACIGNRFDLDTVALVSGLMPAVARQELEEAVEEGLLVATPGRAAGDAAGDGPAYAFLHDRVQQAAYALIPMAQRQQVHLALGRMLLARWPAGDDRLFDIVHHLNLGRALIGEDDERLYLARLDLDAGRKAKASSAFQAALAYFQAGAELMSGAHWSVDHDLAFALHLEEAECLYLCGEEDRAEACVDRLLERAGSRLERSGVYALRMVRYEYMTRYAEAITVGHKALALFGVAFPEATAERATLLERELAAIDALVGGRPIDSLIDLPLMTDPETQAVMRLLVALHTPCYLAGEKLLTLLNTSTMVRLSLEHGYIAESAQAYVLHAMHVGQVRGNFRDAYEFGMLALRLNERLPDPGLRAKALMNLAWAVSIWRKPFEDSFQYTREAFRLGNETGLFSDAGYALFNEEYLALLGDAHLSAVRQRCDVNIAYLRRIKMDKFIDGPRVILQWALALQGQTVAPTSLSDASFDEDAYRQTHAGQTLFEMFFGVVKLAVAYTFGDYALAAEATTFAERAIRDYTGTIWDELWVFYSALTLLAMHGEMTPEARAAADQQLDGMTARLARWADNAPSNFRAQYLLVLAERARVARQDAEAGTLYAAAIEAASEQRCPRELALACELAAAFWERRGENTVATLFRDNALRAYAAWGATAKVAALEHRRDGQLAPALSGPAPMLATGAATEPPGSAEAIDHPLDATTVMKVARAISAEIELDRLLDTLLRMALENAGAERGSLVLEHDGNPSVHACGTMEEIEVRVPEGIPLDDAAHLAQCIVRWVRRTRESLVLSDAALDDRYASDPYIARERPRSVLCTPVLNQGRLVGLLYLENNLATGAFTPARLQVMQLLASQAAVAIENARLFAEVRRLRDQLQAENVYLREEIRTQHGFEEIVGRSPALRKVLGQVEQIAPLETTVLVLGETGTGKELIARALHSLSPRAARALVTVNCGAIAAGLVESELFGHEKGAFTGASARKIGRFELADGGTIFLDEIGDLPLDLQTRLLRVLQEGEIERVGGARMIKVDVRVIAATHRDLAQAVRDGRFRADLYYRLNVFPLRMPALRERREDIPLLARHFVLRQAAKLGKRIDTIPKATLDLLSSYDWPGNVRELGNIIERSIIISTGSALELGDWTPANGVGSPGVANTRALTLEQMERAHIVAALESTAWRVSGPRGAAQLLGVKPTTLEARMRKMGISRPT